jgi:hypothetical protein
MLQGIRGSTKRKCGGDTSLVAVLWSTLCRGGGISVAEPPSLVFASRSGVALGDTGGPGLGDRLPLPSVEDALATVPTCGSIYINLDGDVSLGYP